MAGRLTGMPLATLERAASPMGSRRSALAAASLAGIVLAGVVAAAALWAAPALSGLEVSVQAIEDLILSWGAWGVVASILLMVVHSFVPFPAEVVAMANGMLYGPIWGTAITWAGAMLGAWLAFGLARRLGRPFVQAMVAERHHHAIERFAGYEGGGVLLLSRFIPVISFNLINYAAGLTAISWWTFTWATGLGILPLTCLMVLAGHHMWSGEVEIWLWLLLAAGASWLVWRYVTARLRRPGHRTAVSGRFACRGRRSHGASACGRAPGHSDNGRA
jgi:uncharacterized membrane protein YdjX (TVP38/TMEM64 family)